MTWVVTRNPHFAGMEPRILRPACHDLTPMIDVYCSFCRAMNHIHESQIEGAPQNAELAMNCAGCGLPNVTTVALVRASFADMRREGWYE